MISTRTAAAVLLTVASLLSCPGAARAAPAPPDPWTRLVPRVPPGWYLPWQIDTPDQLLAPRVYEPTAAEDAVEPPDAAAGTYALVEYVPLEEVATRTACTKRTGPYQRAVERWLKLKVDGKQSAADCKAVRAFQQAQKIQPAIGFAGPVTWARMQLISAGKNPNAGKKCPVRTYRVACVDLDRQVTWVQKGTKVVFGPVSMRSGRAVHPTRKGWHTVYWRHKNHVSTLYGTPMPYAQFFDGGQAFHAVYGSIHTVIGSMGCVNLTLGDARALWGVLKNGDKVYVWGHRPGT
ncbi:MULTISPECIES: L,D-transpeptidase family protein [Streptomyces]|jgi:hypothetical protein|uniref:L,D-transpeptidase family protein n=1 Tax=Streptomyces sp. 900129855 TaxID=3155129 RepID=A0ABV2ZZN9_9ACTN